MPTFDNTLKLLHVVVCFAVVHHCSDGEDQLRLYLREPVEHTLSHRTEKKWWNKMKKMVESRLAKNQAESLYKFEVRTTEIMTFSLIL